MKIANFFKRINTIKHKYKVQFTIDVLNIASNISQQLTVMIKRGSNKLSTNPGKLRKGKLDFKKQKLIFEEVTMFYDESSGQYLSKDCEIKVLIHGDGGQRKLAGIVNIDLSEYLNDRLQFKRQQRDLQKCPQKHKAKISYQVYLKFLRQSNSQTAGSVIGQLKPRKANKKQQETTSTQLKNSKPNKKQKKQLLLNDDILDDNNQNQQKNNKEKPKKSNNSNPITVHFDKQMQLNQKDDKMLDDDFSDQQPKQKQVQNQLQSNTVGQFLGANKRTRESQQIEDIKKQDKKNKNKNKNNPKTSQKQKEQLQRSPYQELQSQNIPALSHQDTEQQMQLFKRLQKQTNRLSKQNSQLQLKTIGLKQRALQAEQQKLAQIEQISRDTTYDNIGKYQIRIKQIQKKIQQSKKSKKQNMNLYEQLLSKYQQIKASQDNQRVNVSIDLQSLQKQNKAKIEKLKQQIKLSKSGIEKMQKQYKNINKQVIQLRREQQQKKIDKKDTQTRIIQIELALNQLKNRVAQAINIAGMEGDPDLNDFLMEQFIG